MIIVGSVLIRKDDKILLFERKEEFKRGLIHLPAGRIRDFEDIEEGTKREVFEETGIKVKDLELAAVLEFFRGKKLEILMHVFEAKEFEGEPKETEEGKPFWSEKIPFERMWEDNKYWLPLVLKGEKVFGIFRYDKDWNFIDGAVYILKFIDFTKRNFFHTPRVFIKHNEVIK